MQYLSTRNNKLRESFSQVLFQGLSKDGGLFLPTAWPKINISELHGLSYQEVALKVISPFVKENFDYHALELIINQTYKSFKHSQIAPLFNVEKNKYILELFYGPTLSFKDYAMQFLGNCFTHMLQSSNKRITILGATSGDTGSAAIEAFKGKQDIKVYVLHPYNMVSDIQRRQMTTVQNNNIYNIALKGTFDDCQKIVKQLFLDIELQSLTALTAVNSINFVRLIAQSVYYFWAYVQLNQEQISFVVPSGNFGNIFSARIAKYMGLPIEDLIVVTNENDILQRTITSGRMQIQPVKKTYSPSMDIQISSNFERQIFESMKRDSKIIKEIMKSFTEKKDYTLPNGITNDLKLNYKAISVSNSQTLKTINNFQSKYNYLPDPHTATGLNVLEMYQSNNHIVSLGCAHPAKFGDVIEKATGLSPKLPNELKKIFDKKEKFIILDNNTEVIKKYIIETL